MNTKILEKLLNLIYLLEHEENWESYGVSGFDFFEVYHQDLNKELHKNLFGKKSYKIDVISHYLLKTFFALNTLDSVRDDEELFFKNKVTYDFLKNEFDSTIKIIIVNCFFFGLDFDKIMRKLKIPNRIIDMGFYQSQKNIFQNNDTSLPSNSSYIFKDNNAYKLFMYNYFIHENSKFYLAEISFLYRVMYDEGLIKEFCRPEVFRRWLAENNLKNTSSSIKVYTFPSENEKKYTAYIQSKRNV